MTLTERTFAYGATYHPSGAEPVGRNIDALFDRFVSELRLVGDRDLIRRAEGFERRLERERLVVAARVAGSSGDVASDRKRARGLLGSPSRSRRSTTRDARRAAAVAANPSLEAKVADGSIAADSLDALGKAADPDTGHIPDELIDNVVGLSPGQTDHAVDRHLEDNADRDDVNDRHRRQMQARKCRRGFRPAGEGKPDMATMVLEGPDSIIDRIWNQVCASADAAYKADGGRDRPVGEHVPWEHRLFDAAVEFFDGTASGGSKPAVVVSISLNDLGVKPATQSGTGPISDQDLAKYVARSPIWAMFCDGKGQPLWLGRTRRRRSAFGLTNRVRLRRTRRLTPWNAPAKGRTDIDQLALVCGPCHRVLHQQDLTLYRQTGPGGKTVWHTRPATLDETPPPQTIQRE